MIIIITYNDTNTRSDNQYVNAYRTKVNMFMQSCSPLLGPLMVFPQTLRQLLPGPSLTVNVFMAKRVAKFRLDLQAVRRRTSSSDTIPV